MKIIDNINERLQDDLIKEIKPGSKIQIAAAYFSIYAYRTLKKQLESIAELQFIFTSPTFSTEKAPKEKREFYIPQLSRERSIYGTEFEIKLRNELTQKAIAQECVAWIKKKVTFKSNNSEEQMSGFINILHQNSVTYLPIHGFTTVDLGVERGRNNFNLVTKIDNSPESKRYLDNFTQIWNDTEHLQDVTAQVIDSITAAYKENPAEYIYFIALYNIFREFLKDISEDVLPNEGIKFKDSQIWNKLYDFQKDAALAIINKLETYNGCILADSVGLGKTFTALAVMKYYNDRNKNILVLCPKKLANNWTTFESNYRNNPISKDRLHYDVLYHTDLSRKNGFSNGIDLSRIYWENYDLIVIDESHNFRNGGQGNKDGAINRYSRLLNEVIRLGVKKKVLMLSATPVNNRFVDLKNQLALAYEGKPALINEKLKTQHSIETIFSRAQSKFNEWSKLPTSERSTEKLLKMLDFDFFELLDSVTIARSRKHIQKYYNMADIGQFPTRNKPISIRSSLTDLHQDGLSFNNIYALLNLLKLAVYIPSEYIHPSKLHKYTESNSNLTRAGREEGLRRLMSINLLKRLESSVQSFRLTVERIQQFIEETIANIEKFELSKEAALVEEGPVDEFSDFDLDDQNDDLFSASSKVEIDLADMDYLSWKQELESDVSILKRISSLLAPITPEHDSKLQDLISIVKDKIENPINPGNKKILIFTAFADTAAYLYTHLTPKIKAHYGLDSALVTGAERAKTTLSKFTDTANLNHVLTLFSPISKERSTLFPQEDTSNIDILFATDCISEGQNLQDCDYLVNYDIHWNPVRIIQRFGRIDRIGSKNKCIQMVNFWPDLTLDDYIQLKNRVETRMKISVLTSTGDDDLINIDEKGDLEYRKKQLERLQTEVVDLEDVNGGVSIMDLGLNEFRLDLLEYMKNTPAAELAPHGLHAVLEHTEDCPPGVIFVLRNINSAVNIDKKNALHPFYMVYIDMQGQVIYDYLAPKAILDKLRLLCKGKTLPNASLCQLFNQETKDGKDMHTYSKLLSDAIKSIIQVKEESDIDSLFKPGGTSALTNTIKGLDDFELICFFVVK